MKKIDDLKFSFLKKLLFQNICKIWIYHFIDFSMKDVQLSRKITYFTVRYSFSIFFFFSPIIFSPRYLVARFALSVVENLEQKSLRNKRCLYTMVKKVRLIISPFLSLSLPGQKRSFRVPDRTISFFFLPRVHFLLEVANYVRKTYSLSPPLLLIPRPSSPPRKVSNTFVTIPF